MQGGRASDGVDTKGGEAKREEVLRKSAVWGSSSCYECGCAGCVRVVFKAFVDIVCDVLPGVVGFRVRACCVVFVRVFCDKCVDACVGASCL